MKFLAQKKPPLAGEVSRIGMKGSSLLRNVRLFTKGKYCGFSGVNSGICTNPYVPLIGDFGA
jgi:hypothetical protein